MVGVRVRYLRYVPRNGLIFGPRELSLLREIAVVQWAAALGAAAENHTSGSVPNPILAGPVCRKRWRRVTTLYRSVSLVSVIGAFGLLPVFAEPTPIGNEVRDPELYRDDAFTVDASFTDGDVR